MRRVENWTRVPSVEMAECFEREAARWRAHLDWDTTATWNALDGARRSGTVPGFVTRDERGAVVGWTYYVLHGGDLQIGALVAPSPAVGAALLDAVLASPEAVLADRSLFFAYTETPGMMEVLAQRGFHVGMAHYVVRELAAPASVKATLPSWRDEALGEVAEVLRAAYGVDCRRAFVPSGALDDWRQYVQQLTLTTGCGQFLPELSPLAPAAGGGLDGAAIVTRVSATTAHLAQLAVRSEAGGRGLGRRLLAAVMDGVAARGFTRISLLVSDTNARGRRLYAAHGFEPRATFVTATLAHRDARATGHRASAASRSLHPAALAQPGR